MQTNLPEENVRLRNSIEDSVLRTRLQTLWNSAEKELHPFQKGETGQGFYHCLRVEQHVWSLIHDHIEKFRSRELFILSASCALHDIGKMGNEKNAVDHGKLGKDFLLKNKNWEKYFEDKVQAKAVANVICVHCNGEIDTLQEEFVWGNPPTIPLRSLAAIFRLADMLDSDYRRCPHLAFSFKKLKFPNKLKRWVARRSISGWHISPDGKRIVLIASPENEKEKVTTLAYVDSLNDALSESHKRHLENCRVRYLSIEGKIIDDTLHFPTTFSYREGEGSKIEELSGLIELYSNVAKKYISRISTIFANVDLRGMGDFSDRKDVRLLNVFIDVNVTFERAPENYEAFDKKAVDWATRHLSKGEPIVEVMKQPKLTPIVLLGDPGSGKTTISRYLCLKHPSYVASENTCVGKNETIGIPFLVTIRDFVSEGSEEHVDALIDYISNKVRARIGKPVPTGFVEFWLSKETTLTIFDGLDEVIIPEKREKIRGLVTIFCQKYPACKILVTSRRVGYNEAPLDSNKFLHLKLSRLERSHIKSFVINWYTEREPEPTYRQQQVKGLLEALKERHVSELAQNPLLLTIMTLIHRGEADLPKQRALLYGKCVEAFMVSRNRAKDLLSYDENEIRACHEYLGYWIHTRAEETARDLLEVPIEELQKALLKNMTKRHPDSEMSPKAREEKTGEFVDAARKRVGLIVERGEGIWSFGHRSFQEYFAARYISHHTFGIDNLWHEIKAKIGKSHWVEPLKLLAGIYGVSNRQALDEFANRLMEKHFETADPSLQSLVLLGEIAGEVALKYSTLEPMADEIIKQLLDTKDYALMNDLKRILNHFYNTPLWNRIVKQLRKRAHALNVNPSIYSGSAFYTLLVSKHFGDSRIDRILATL